MSKAQQIKHSIQRTKYIFNKTMRYIGILLSILLKLIWWLIVAILVVIGGWFIVSHFLEDSYRVERSIEIAHPPKTVFTYLKDYQQRDVWDPLLQIDTSLQYHLKQKPKERTRWQWDGKKIGTGELVFQESKPNSSLIEELNIQYIEHLNPVKSRWEWKLEGADGCTTITCINEGNLSYPFERIMVLTAEDYVIGPQMENALKNLKAFIEYEKQ